MKVRLFRCCEMQSLSRRGVSRRTPRPRAQGVAVGTYLLGWVVESARTSNALVHGMVPAGGPGGCASGGTPRSQRKRSVSARDRETRAAKIFEVPETPVRPTENATSYRTVTAPALYVECVVRASSAAGAVCTGRHGPSSRALDTGQYAVTRLLHVSSQNALNSNQSARKTTRTGRESTRIVTKC